MLRLTSGILKIAILVAPIVLFAILGASYLVAIFRTLESPGVPIEFKFESAQGKAARIYASSYSLDISNGFARVNQLQFDGGEGTLARADAVELTGLNALYGADQVFKARVTNLSGRLVRLASGRLEIDDYLPEGDDQPSETPFTARIDNVDLTIIDRAGKGWSTRVRAPRLLAAGAGDNWIAHGRGKIDDMGEIDIRVQSIRDIGLSLTGTTPQIQLAGLANHLTTTPESKDFPDLRSASVKSATIKGPFRIFLPTEQNFVFESSVVAEAVGIRYADYRVDAATFRGRLTEVGAVGEFAGRFGPNRATGKASFRWDKSQQVAGYVSVSSPSKSALPTWLQELVPVDASYQNGGFNGYVAYLDTTGLQLVGRVKANTAEFQGQSLAGIDARVHYANDKALVKLDRGLFEGQSTGGVLAFDARSQELKGALNTVRVNLAEVGRIFDVPGLTGFAIVSAMVSGTSSNPIVNFNASGNGSYRYKRETFDASAFQVSGTYERNAIRIKRAMVDSPAALITAEGSIGMNGSVGIDVLARGVQPSKFDSRLGGTANLTARVTGTLSDPQVKGDLEGYALTYEGELLPVAKSAFSANLREARFSELEAVRGGAVLEGSGRYVFESGAIEGDLSAAGIQITELLGEDYVGSLEVPSLEISGTLDKPIIAGQLRGMNLVARGIKISTLNARVETVGDRFQLVDTFAHAAGGTVVAHGGYNLKEKDGEFTLSASNLDVEQLMPEFSPYVSAGGQISGEAAVTLVDNQLRTATGNGLFSSIEVNGTALGSGDWDLNTEGTLIKANLQVGQLDRFIIFEGLAYDTEAKTIAGELSVFNQQLGDLVAISKRYLPDSLSYDSRRALNSIEGTLSLTASVTGDIENPVLEVPVLDARNIEIRDAKFASLTANVRREGRTWTVNDFTLSGDEKLIAGLGRRGQAKYAVTGSVDEAGDMDLNGEFTNIGVSEFAALVPWFTGKTGEADVFITATGPTNKPNIRASLTANGLLGELDPVLMAELSEAELRGGLDPEKRQEFYGKTLSVDLSEINISEGAGNNKGVNVIGNYTYRGFQGTLVASTGFAYPFEIMGGSPASGRLTVDASTLDEIATYVEAFDPARSKGSLTGAFVASGTPDNLDLVGDVRLAAETVALDVMTDSVKNLVAEISLRSDRLEFRATGESTRGGDILANASVPVPNLGNFAQSVNDGLTDTLLGGQVEGGVKVTNLAFQQPIADGKVSAIVAGDITLGGTVRRPLIGGNIALSSVDTQIPAIETEDADAEARLIDPQFDLKVALSSPAHIRNSAADLYLLGDGTIKGSLSKPNVIADFYVDRGNLNLPGARIRIEQGGTVDLRYDATTRDSEASVKVDLEGVTAVSALRYGDTVERYDIFLGIKGDLLTEGGLVLTASSDPPDLSQDRILALIGQTDLISNIGSGLAGGGIGTDTQKQLQSALIGYALPSLLDPVTRGLSQSLGLDYLNLEYNAYQQATFVFSRPLGGGFSLQGRRELTEPPPGFLQQYEIRLVYRPRRLPGVFNRFTFSVGADEQRPWKIAIEYGTRF